jgi:DNA-binding protein HU-beta
MNKAQLVDKIATDAKCTKAQAESVLDTAIESIKKAVSKGDDVKLVGFGTFSRSKRKARTGRNPQTGAEIQIPASKIPKFKAGKEFKDLMN